MGGGWYVYTFQNVRGDARKEGYENAIRHWEHGHELGRAAGGPEYLLHMMLLGRLYVSESKVRNLPRAIELYSEAYSKVSGYEPLLLAYAEGLYQLEEFDKAIEVAIELHRRALREYPDKDQFPEAAIYLAAKACRAKVKKLKKGNLYQKALEASTELLSTGVATETDEASHKTLVELAAKTNA